MPCAYREAARLASLTIRGSFLGVELSVPIFEVPAAVAGSSTATAAVPQAEDKRVAPAPTAEVLELQRRLAAGGDENVAALLTDTPAQLDPLNVQSISRWLQAKGRNMEIAEEQIHIHAQWRQAFMPAGHIPEVCLLVKASTAVHVC